MDRQARNKLVEDHLPLVGFITRDLHSRARHLSRDDLSSAGSVALVKAADSFDPSRGVPFGAYARHRIVGGMLDEMRRNDWATRSARQRMRQSAAARDALTAALGREPSPVELADALGVPVAEVESTMLDQGRSFTSLDVVADSLVADAASPEEMVLAEEREQMVRAAVSALPQPMRTVIEEVYFRDRSVTDVAADMGVTHSAVSQHRSEAIRLLGDGLRAHYTDPEAGHERTSKVARHRHRAFMDAFVSRTAGGYVRARAGGLAAA